MAKHGKYTGLRRIAAEKGIAYGLLQNRIRYGYTLEQALAMPKHSRRPKPQRLVAVSIEAVLRSWGRA